MQEGISEHGSSGNLLFTFEEGGLQHSKVLYSSNSKVCSWLPFLSWQHVQFMGLKGNSSEQCTATTASTMNRQDLKAQNFKKGISPFLLLTILPDPQFLARRQHTVGEKGGSKGCDIELGHRLGKALFWLWQICSMITQVNSLCASVYSSEKWV